MFPDWILYPIIFLFLCMVILFSYRISSKVRRWFSQVMSVPKTLLSILGIIKGKETAPVNINESLEVAGYAYDPHQDIFYSILNPWQRKFGYCRVYDEAAAPMGMIIDCEPVYFEYDGKKWLIEFWKGQYDLTTGCEIGIYTTKGPDLNIPGVFHGTFYDCANEIDFLHMAYSLKKNGRTIFIRRGIHWWLTGFKLGVFSEPSELSMHIRIILKDRIMRNAFLQGLRKTGYSDSEFEVDENTVSLIFSKPHSSQPLSRSKATDAVIQMKNKLLCDQYKEATKGCKTLKDKFKAIQEKSPELLGHISGLGRPKQLYNLYRIIGREEDV